MSTPPLTASANHRHSIKFSTTDQVLIRPGLTRESGAWGVRRGAGSVGRGLQINAIGLGFGGGQKGLEGFNTGLGEPAGGDLVMRVAVYYPSPTVSAQGQDYAALAVFLCVGLAAMWAGR